MQTGRHPDIFVRYRVTRTTVRVSAGSIGGHSNDLSTDPAINGDGSPVAFFTLAATRARATASPAASTTK